MSSVPSVRRKWNGGRSGFVMIDREAAEARQGLLQRADETGRKWLSAWGLFCTLAVDYADPEDGRVSSSVAAIARDLHIDRGTVTGYLDLLEKAGLVTQDGRGWQVARWDELQGREVPAERSTAGSPAGSPAGNSSSPPPQTDPKKERTEEEVPPPNPPRDQDAPLVDPVEEEPEPTRNDDAEDTAVDDLCPTGWTDDGVHALLIECVRLRGCTEDDWLREPQQKRKEAKSALVALLAAGRSWEDVTNGVKGLDPTTVSVAGHLASAWTTQQSMPPGSPKPGRNTRVVDGRASPASEFTGGVVSF